MNYTTILLATVREPEHEQLICYYGVNLCAGVGGFLPAVKQIANVAALPGIVGVSHD